MTDESAFRDAVTRHPLAKYLDSQQLSVRNNVIEVGELPPMSYLAAIISDILRRAWIAQGDSFVFETVMSSGDKIDLLAAAKARGYRTYLYYICTEAAVINQQRVLSRVELGGHSVSPEKIAERYDRSLALLPSAIANCDRAYLFDNSESVHRLVAEFEGGRSVHLHSPYPEWFVQAVLKTAQ